MINFINEERIKQRTKAALSTTSKVCCNLAIVTDLKIDFLLFPRVSFWDGEMWYSISAVFVSFLSTRTNFAVCCRLQIFCGCWIFWVALNILCVWVYFSTLFCSSKPKVNRQCNAMFVVLLKVKTWKIQRIQRALHRMMNRARLYLAFLVHLKSTNVWETLKGMFTNNWESPNAFNHMVQLF